MNCCKKSFVFNNSCLIRYCMSTVLIKLAATIHCSPEVVKLQLSLSRQVGMASQVAARVQGSVAIISRSKHDFSFFLVFKWSSP